MLKISIDKPQYAKILLNQMIIWHKCLYKMGIIILDGNNIEEVARKYFSKICIEYEREKEENE